ncbi:MAG: hypothetical protein U0694_29080 [Anaerolineae bacterium]
MEQQNPLHPYTALELLDRTFRIYRDNFMSFLVPVALVTVPVTILNLISSELYTQRVLELQPLVNDIQRAGRSASISAAQQRELLSAASEVFNVIFIFLGFVMLTSLIQTVLMHSIVTQMASESHLGYRVTAGEAFRAVRGRLLPLLGGMIVAAIIFGLLAAAITVVTGLLPICGLFFMVLIYVWLALFSLLPPTIVLERASVGLALRRAWSLGKARVWQILGITVAIGLINYIITLGLTTALGLFVPDTSSLTLDAGDIATLIIQFVVTIVVSPVIPIAFTLLYYDARVRVEGLDIALQNSPIANARPADLDSPQPTDTLVSGRDFGSMVMMAIVVVGFGGLVLCGLSAIAAPLLSRF